MVEEVLALKSISKCFGNFSALKSVNMSVKQGEFCALVGENGAGKTTMIRIILGLSRASTGTLSLFGESDRKLVQSMRMRIGYMPDSCGAWLSLSARENLETRCVEWGIPSAEAGRLLSLVGLEGAGRKPVRAFSLGMKRRLDLAVALLGNPDLIILDEPFNGLDPMALRDMRTLLKSLHSEMGKTIVMSSHNLNEVQRVATNFCFLAHGEVLQMLSREEFDSQSSGLIAVRTSNPKAASAILTKGQEEFHPVLSGDGALVISADQGDVSGIVSALFNRGVNVYEVTRVRKSLEDYYFDLVGGAD